jgi:hypothetical protein
MVGTQYLTEKDIEMRNDEESKGNDDNYIPVGPSVE